MNHFIKDWDKLSKEEREIAEARLRKTLSKPERERTRPAFRIVVGALLLGIVITGYMTRTWFGVIGGILGLLAVIGRD